jgi:hypothetical protein
MTETTIEVELPVKRNVNYQAIAISVVRFDLLIRWLWLLLAGGGA